MAQQKTKEALKPRQCGRLDPILIFAGLGLAGRRPSSVRCGFQISEERSEQTVVYSRACCLQHSSFSPSSIAWNVQKYLFPQISCSFAEILTIIWFTSSYTRYDSKMCRYLTDWDQPGKTFSSVSPKNLEIFINVSDSTVSKNSHSITSQWKGFFRVMAQRKFP